MTEREIDQERDKPEVKTFPVPFALEEIKKNITITTKTTSKTSKEQIINQAFKFHSQGNISEAAKYYQYFINQGFKDHRVFSNYGLILKNLRKSIKAEILIRKAIELNPNYAEAHSNLGSILKDLGNLQDAELSTRKAIELKPDFANAHCNLGNILSDLGNLQDAEISQRKAIDLKPDFAQAHSNLGAILKDLGKLKDAELSTRKAIELKPDFAQAHSNLGAILKDLGKLKDAEISQRKAIELKPDFAQAHSHLGNTLRDLGNLKDAEISQRKAIELNPDFAEAHSNLGNTLRDLGNLQEAEISQRKAIELNPDFAQAHSHLGNTLKDLGNLKEAELSTRKAIELKPDFAQAHSNLGNTLKALDNLQEAEFSYRKAIELKPDFADAHYNLGNLLKDLGDFHDAINQFKKALKLNNQSSLAKTALIATKGIICDWSDEGTHNMWLKSLGIKGKPIPPWELFSIEDNPLNHLERSKNFYKKNFIRPTKKIKSSKKNIIHIGYFSADFLNHPVMQLIAPLLELHDKSRFKIYLYSFVPKEDEYTERAKKSGCIFRNITKLNDIEAVELARNDELDIAVDLMGYTRNNRMPIFSYRVAQIQINYMGFNASVGSDTIDYIIADKITIPRESEKFYSEKIIRMPNCFLCNDNKKVIYKESIFRKDFNLPDQGFIFTCFNNNYKITKKRI